MFGNKYQGDAIAKEFYKLVSLKKMASQEESEESLKKIAQDDSSPLDLQPQEEEVLDPAEFLESIDETPNITERLESKIDDLESWPKDEPQAEVEESEDFSYLIDRKAMRVLNGLGKIAGSLKSRGEDFAADMVEATALSIKGDIVKEANKKLETVTVLSKIASEISEEGDEFTSDIVKATIKKIKSN